jgi:hypothetical protein
LGEDLEFALGECCSDRDGSFVGGLDGDVKFADALEEF